MTGSIQKYIFKLVNTYKEHLLISPLGPLGNDILLGWGALILFVAVLFLLGIVEGLQLALIELKRQKPETYR